MRHKLPAVARPRPVPLLTLAVLAVFLGSSLLVPGLPATEPSTSRAAAAVEPPPGGLVNSVADFGRLEGGFSVSDDGAAKYTLPLWMPRGRGNVAPALTLSYSSRDGEGPFGVGWSLGGLSSIAWCPRTVAQDGKSDGLHTDGTSALCLGGNRLLPVSSAFSPQRQFRTERATFARIVAYYDRPDNVPDFFRVWSKDGRILTFGETADSRLKAYPLQQSPNWKTPAVIRAPGDRVTLAWGLNRVEDRNGNAAAVTYRRAEGSETDLWWSHMLPASVSYSPNRRVEFHYEPRPDPIDRFTHGGVHTRIAVRASSIEMWAGPENEPAELLREYRLSYRNDSVTRRSLLHEVRECDHNGACKQRRRFDWSLGRYDFEEVRIIGNLGTKDGWRIKIADVNGDGRADLVHRRDDGVVVYPLSKPEKTWVRRSVANTFTAPQPSSWPLSARPLRIVDLDADGRAEMAALGTEGPFADPNALWRWRLYRSTGTGFAPAVGGGIGDELVPHEYNSHWAYFADLDGNGLPDFVEAKVFTPSSEVGPWHYRLNSGRPGLNRFPDRVQTTLPPASRVIDNFVMDTDGDGRAEILTRKKSPQFGWDSWGLSANGDVETRVLNLGNDFSEHVLFGDVNGDGLDDKLSITRLSDGRPALTALVNTGTGFFSVLPAIPLEHPVNEGDLRFVDVNNDGRDDVLAITSYRPNGSSDEIHRVDLHVWNGSGFTPYPLGLRPSCDRDCDWTGTQPMDFDADGLMDLVHFASGSDDIRLFKRRGGMPDQLVGIDDAKLGTLSERVEVGYTNLADRAVHTPGSGYACDYPRVCPASGGSIVAWHRVANGVGTFAAAWDRYDHRYRSARVDLQGRGWLGFAEHWVARSDTGQLIVTKFDNATRVVAATSEYSNVAVYPHTGVPKAVATQTFGDPNNNGLHYRRTVTYDNAIRRYADGSYFVEQRTATQAEEERANFDAAWHTLRRTTTKTTYDQFGNKDLVESVTDRGRRITEDVEYRDETSARLGRPSRKLLTACTTTNVCTTRESTFDYDDKGNLAVIVVEPNELKLKLTTTVVYGPTGVITSITRTDAAGHRRATTFEYNVDQLYPTAIINALEHRTLIDTHSGLGVPLRTTDPNGVPTTMRYDWFGRLRETSYADGNFEHVEHIQRLLDTKEYVTATVAGGGRIELVLDRLGREVERRIGSFDGLTATAYTVYDMLGRIRRVSRPTMPGEEAQYTQFGYDLRGRVTSVTAPDGAQVRHEYGGTATTTYDAKDTESYAVETPDGDVSRRFEDDPNNLTQWSETSLDYGPFGEPTKLVAPDLTEQTMHYDPLGRRERLDDPSSGATITTYNAFGEVATVTDAENRTTTFEYDPLGRVTKETSPDGVATNTWDTADHGLGRLARARSADGVTTEYTYNESGQTVTTNWTVKGNGYGFTYSYDDIGRLACITYPVIPGAADRLSVGYSYNSHGYLARVTDGCQFGARTYWAAEARTSQLERDRTGNGVVTTRAYDPASGLLNRITTTGPGAVGTLGEIAYTYDANRNVTKRHDLAHQRDETYSYDTLDRLTGWSIQNTDPTPGLNATYTYDAVGNLKTETVQSADGPEETTIYRYGQEGAPPHALTSLNNQKYRYDRAGQQTKGPNRTVRYNTFGLPTVLNWGIGQGQVRRTEFAYDADGTRVLERDADQTSITVAGLFERRTPAGTGFRQIHNMHNIVVDGRVIAQVNRVQAASGGPLIASRITYLHTDLQDSTVALTIRNGQPSSDDSWLREQFYEPFGQRINAQNEAVGGGNRGGPRQGYTGHQHDVEYGLINMKGRIYDPEARRFLTPDPILQNPISSQGHNRYTYVRNNPTTLTDPTGWQPCDELNPSCSGSDSGGEAGVITVVAAAAALFAGWLTGGGGGENIITPDGVDDDVPWPEKTTAGQLATTGESSAEEGYHGIGGWLHKVWYEPAQEGYASWINVPDKLYSSWGGRVPVLGHAAGVVVGTVPWAAGQVGRFGVGVLQFLTPKTEEEHFLFVMSGGLAAATHSVSRIGARAPQLVEASVTSMKLDVQVYRGSKLIFDQPFRSGAGGDLGHAEVKALALFEKLKLLQPGDEVFMYGQYDICGHGICRKSLDSLARLKDVDILYYGYSREPGSQTFFGRGVGHIKMSILNP